MKAVTYYPGSIGELIQGRVQMYDSLVSCPINLFTRVELFECKEAKYRVQSCKAYLMLKNLLKDWDCERYLQDLDIEISSQIPKEKGFASSTADLCGVYFSALKLFDREFSIEELVRQCIKIEPTDSIIFDKATLFDYKKGEKWESIGEYPEAFFLVFEGERNINTVDFNKNMNCSLAGVDDLLEELKEGIIKSDLSKIAKASTESIFRNLNRLPYESFKKIKVLQENTGGLGIVGAHSGDMLAVIYAERKDLERAYKLSENIVGYKKYMLNSLTHIYR